MNSLMENLSQFRREVEVRGGSVDKALFVLFAYVHTALNMPTGKPLTDFTDALLGPAKQRASEKGSTVSKTGKIDFKIDRVLTNCAPQKRIAISINSATANDVAAMLAGSHPLAQSVLKGEMTFESGKELCHLVVYFDDGVSMVIAVSQGPDYIGVEHYLVKDGELLDTTGVPVQKDSIGGSYYSFISDKPEDGKDSIPTHVVDVYIKD